MPADRTSVPPATIHRTHNDAVYQVLSAIPAGRITSYGRLAQLAGLGRGARQVGRILSQLPEDTRLPWHRVVNSQGYLSLPADSASGQEQLQRLLAEGVIIRNRRVDMKRFGWPG
ncbi:MAG TPA: MGMT family protein [Pseudomonas xinjiangensis]|uniref:MGMT family protein n=2 Tax=root TaxID=1 RepID=A0A7V1BMW7_9GAMM|nr:MGMT family protein [Halopseudomonas xinjiangensis]HEC47936.1 MGMT family protein [Halopseudomonas xinjiangensis]